jgi:outer membrane lipoprotein SlyB
LIEEWLMPAQARTAVALCALLALGAGLSACAPATTNTTVSPYALGTAGYATYGTVLQVRPVRMTGTRSGVGAATGAVGGGVIGSTIGGDWRARAVGGVAGALIGGVAGAAVEEGVTSGVAYEFIIDLPGRRDPLVVTQTNEEGIQPGECVAITQTDRARLTRAPGACAPQRRPYGK